MLCTLKIKFAVYNCVVCKVCAYSNGYEMYAVLCNVFKQIISKDFENLAVLGAITEARDVGSIGAQPIQLYVNGETRQDASLAEMIHDVPAILSDLSQYYKLQAGDVILTGTPAGVGPLVRGDHAVGRIEGLEPVAIRIQS